MSFPYSFATAGNGGTTVDVNQRKVLAVDFLTSTECAGGIASTEWDTQGHGSHVAGTIAGDNFANPIAHDAGDGMAPGANIGTEAAISFSEPSTRGSSGN